MSRSTIAATCLSFVPVLLLTACNPGPPAGPVTGSPAPASAALSYEERQGQALFAKYCAVCHGTEGKGDGFNAFNLDPRPRDLSDSAYMSALSDEQILQTVSGGGRSVNKSPLMPSYGHTLSRREIGFVTRYLRTLSITSTGKQ